MAHATKRAVFVDRFGAGRRGDKPEIPVASVAFQVVNCLSSGCSDPKPPKMVAFGEGEQERNRPGTCSGNMSGGGFNGCNVDAACTTRRGGCRVGFNEALERKEGDRDQNDPRCCYPTPQNSTASISGDLSSSD